MLDPTPLCLIDLVKLYLEEKGYEVCLQSTSFYWTDGWTIGKKRNKTIFVKPNRWCSVHKDKEYIADIFVSGTYMWISRSNISLLRWSLDFANPDTTFSDVEDLLQDVLTPESQNTLSQFTFNIA